MERRVPVVDRTDCFRAGSCKRQTFSFGRLCPTAWPSGLQHRLLWTEPGRVRAAFALNSLGTAGKWEAALCIRPRTQRKQRHADKSWIRVRQIEQPGSVQRDPAGSMFHCIDLCAFRIQWSTKGCCLARRGQRLEAQCDMQAHPEAENRLQGRL